MITTSSSQFSSAFYRCIFVHFMSLCLYKHINILNNGHFLYFFTFHAFFFTLCTMGNLCTFMFDGKAQVVNISSSECTCISFICTMGIFFTFCTMGIYVHLSSMVKHKLGTFLAVNVHAYPYFVQWAFFFTFCTMGIYVH